MVVEVVVDVMRVKPVLWLVWCGCAVDIDLCGCLPVLVDLFMRVFSVVVGVWFNVFVACYAIRLCGILCYLDVHFDVFNGLLLCWYFFFQYCILKM